MAKPESKREEYRRYLEKSGVLDALTRVLVSLYEEKERPDNALEYFLDQLAAKTNLKAEIQSMKAEITELQTKLDAVEAENENLKARIGQHTGGENLLNPPADGEELNSNHGETRNSAAPTHSIQQNISKMPVADSDPSAPASQQDSGILKD